MIRNKLNRKAKQPVAAILSAIVLMESGLSSACVGTVHALEQEIVTISSNELSGSIQTESDTKNAMEEESEDIEAPPEENNDFVVEEDTVEVLRAESAYMANTETKKVAIDSTSIAPTQVYKDKDYSHHPTVWGNLPWHLRLCAKVRLLKRRQLCYLKHRIY